MSSKSLRISVRRERRRSKRQVFSIHSAPNHAASMSCNEITKLATKNTIGSIMVSVIIHAQAARVYREVSDTADVSISASPIGESVHHSECSEALNT